MELSVIERNNTRKSVNIIRVTEVSKNFDSIVNVYSPNKRNTSNKIINFLKDILWINKNKIVWHNARIHTPKDIKEFIKQYEYELFILNPLPYSLMLNPQENV